MKKRKEVAKNRKARISVAPVLERFFCEYLIRQRNVSPAPVAGYRDTFRLLLNFVKQEHRKMPSSLTFAELDASQILAFLDHLEKKRKNSVRSRNTRLAAIRSFMHYAGLQEPIALPGIKRVLAIPLKRFDRRSVDYLSREEVTALLDAPDTATWSGHRDMVMLATLYNTGTRVSEIIRLNIGDVRIASTATLRVYGKGRKERVVPLWKTVSSCPQSWR